MSILDHLLNEYSKDYKPPSIAWRERRVWHRTKSGEMHYVKIKSLAPEEQMKYKPIDLARKKKKTSKYDKAKKRKNMPGMGAPAAQPEPEKAIEGELFDFYYGVKDKEKYKDFEEGKYVMATLEPSKAADMEEDEEVSIVFVANVPIDAVKEYMDEEGDWKKIEIEDKDQKAEFIKFEDTDFFKIDLYPYKDKLEPELQDEEEKEESVNNYEKYITEKMLSFYSKNNSIRLLTEENGIEKIDTSIVQIAKYLADKTGLKFDGFWDIPPGYSYINMAQFTDPETNTSIVYEIKKDNLEDILRGFINKIRESRKQFVTSKEKEKVSV